MFPNRLTSRFQRPAPASADELTWDCIRFEDLTPDELYAALELRQRVFVVEQNCAYLDCDGADQLARHLFGWQGSGKSRRLMAYARILPPRAKYAESSIGRVVTDPDARGSGGGRSLMAEALRLIEAAGWGPMVKIAAQMYLERFYEQFGFKRVSEPYTEDNIWHVDMLRG
ncbi:MAG TPA: GNAT family N-acetyltransferase [Gemmatimonadaceae bacterium]|nr:GNAT family N-acetyltransferase [Gemmatimonadaceae bacterium]